MGNSLELTAAEFAATRVAPEQVQNFEDLVSQLETSIRHCPENGDLFRTIDLRFHWLLIKASGNTPLLSTYNSFTRQIALAMEMVELGDIEADALPTVHSVVLTVKQRNPVEAGLAMPSHACPLIGIVEQFFEGGPAGPVRLVPHSKASQSRRGTLTSFSASPDNPEPAPGSHTSQSRAGFARFGLGTIRGRLLFGFVVVALLSAAAVSGGSTVIGYLTGREQAQGRLESVAARKALEVQTWTAGLQAELRTAITERYAVERATIVLDLARSNQYYDTYNRAMRRRFQALVGRSTDLNDISLLDLNGSVVLSTDPNLEGQSFREAPFFTNGLAGPTLDVPSYDASNRGWAIAALPVLDDNNELLGVAAGRADQQALVDILTEPTGLGETGKAFLSGAGGQTVPAGRAAEGGQPLVPAALSTSAPLNVASYTDYRGAPVLGVSRLVPDVGAALFVEQDSAEVLRAVSATLTITLALLAFALLLAVGAALLITRSIHMPLAELVDSATAIARGDLARKARVQREDEIGALAQAFNSMTTQLRGSIDGLEQRVRLRTHELEDANAALERRAIQLETSAEVSRGVTSILDIDELLARIVELIHDAFGYSQVIVFLLDKSGQELQMRAGAGSTTPQMSRLQMTMRSLNTEVAQTRQALLINDVVKDPRYLRDAHLTDTCSELVIPLAIGDRTIGTLDVQSTQTDAFLPDDALLLQSLADQVAIAIENAGLYERSRELAVLEERTRLARELHDSVTQTLYSLGLLAEGWRLSLTPADDPRLDLYLARVGDLTQEALREMRLLLHELRPPALEEAGLVGALQQRLEAVENRLGIETSLEVPETVDIPLATSYELYGIAHEALNNALRHARAGRIAVRIETANGEIVQTVVDDGCGFDVGGVTGHGGMGLRSMRERAEKIGGQLRLRSAPGAGTTVQVAAPLQPHEQGQADRSASG